MLDCLRCLPKLRVRCSSLSVRLFCLLCAASAPAQVVSSSALDSLLHLTYCRSAPLSAAYSIYRDSAQAQADDGTDSDRTDSDGQADSDDSANYDDADSSDFDDSEYDSIEDELMTEATVTATSTAATRGSTTAVRVVVRCAAHRRVVISSSTTVARRPASSRGRAR